MPDHVGQPERRTQDRVVRFFQDALGYRYLGNWQDRQENSNAEPALLEAFLRSQGHAPTLIGKAIETLRRATTNWGQQPYERNQSVYNLLRYGVPVKDGAGEKTETIPLVDWAQPEANDFAIAEEVTIAGEHTKRPDVVLYLNGIAIGVLELKRSTADIGAGIRQNLTNQQDRFIGSFFSTIQLILAGNDTEGLRYGTLGTPEKMYMKWKEAEEEYAPNLLDKYLGKMCEKERLLDILQHFVLFDGGWKKLPRPHQYFGIKAAQERAMSREADAPRGGIIWHTQGSGKSIVMVMLARWILEHKPDARVVVLTDRDELDKQIKRVFEDAGETIHRTRSGRDLMARLAQAAPRLLCSLVHKFGARGEAENFDAFIRELQSAPPPVGRLFVFVDECHRTQSGRLHKAMRAALGEDATFIGFTGTPLLKKDKETSLEVFGGYIHTYKFNEAVEDDVVLDLVYESRDIDQELTSPERVDQWFATKTRGLNDYQRAELKRRWGTMQKVLSSRSRMEKIVGDVAFDFAVKPRISADAGNAILVAGSIYEACRYYELFQGTPLAGKCAVITSYNPSARNVVNEDTGEGTETEKESIDRLYTELLTGYRQTTEQYEDWAKAQFIKYPGQMKLLIVVDKLLTGFDAPGCTYLYIDKSMQDHGLFQAICRVNRLDSPDKEVGYIVDYKNLFENVKGAIEVYTSELDYDAFGADEVAVLIKDRLEEGRSRLEEAREALALLCEPVEPPKGPAEHGRYFCGNPEIETDLEERALRRTQLYRGVVALVRAYAAIAESLEEAGYAGTEADRLKRDLDFYVALREEVRRRSGETLDLKTYEADMRHLIDHYISARDPRITHPFADMTILEVIERVGMAEAIDSLPENIRNSQEAVAETIENNVRQKIIRDHPLDPAFYEEMSAVLAELIRLRRERAHEYAEHLRRLAEIAAQVQQPMRADVPETIITPAQLALYNNLGKDEVKALAVHGAVVNSRLDGWRGVDTKERVIKAALYKVLGDVEAVEAIFKIISQQGEY